MKPLACKRARFRLKAFLKYLHHFNLAAGGEGDPLPIEDGGIVYFDVVELMEVLDADRDEGNADDIDIPPDSLLRLQAGYTLYAMFACSDGGCSPLLCADGERIDVIDPDMDEEDSEYEADSGPHRRRTKKYIEQCENTPADESRSYGYLIGLTPDAVTLEAVCCYDVSGECETETIPEPNLVSEPMQKFARSFLRPVSQA